VFVARLAPLNETVPEPATAVIVPPPQEPVRPFGVATTNPAGRLSVKASPVRVMLAAGLETVKLSDVDPFSGIVAAPNPFAIVGGNATVRFALAVLPVPPFVDVTALVVFVYWPDAAPVTVNVKLQLPPDERLRPVSDNELALIVSVPVVHTGVAAKFATVSPAGRVSLNATPVKVSGLAFGLATVNWSEVVAFSAIVEGVNDFAMVGGPFTFKVAVAVPPVPPSVDVMLPVVLTCDPTAMPITFTLNVQLPELASVAPLREMTLVA